MPLDATETILLHLDIEISYSLTQHVDVVLLDRLLVVLADIYVAYQLADLVLMDVTVLSQILQRSKLQIQKYHDWINVS